MSDYLRFVEDIDDLDWYEDLACLSHVKCEIADRAKDRIAPAVRYAATNLRVGLVSLTDKYIEQSLESGFASVTERMRTALQTNYDWVKVYDVVEPYTYGED